MNIHQIITTLTDPENQPHQYVGRAEELINDIFVNNEVRECKVNNMLHADDTERELLNQGYIFLDGMLGRMIFTKSRGNVTNEKASNEKPKECDQELVVGASSNVYKAIKALLERDIFDCCNNYDTWQSPELESLVKRIKEFVSNAPATQAAKQGDVGVEL